jgi:phosphopentomutase
LKISRVIIIVLDSLGVGALPDADRYGDEGSNTLGNMAKALGGLSLPNLETLGLGNIGDFEGIKKRPDCKGAYGKMAEASPGKDTTTGHWEMMGVHLDEDSGILQLLAHNVVFLEKVHFETASDVALQESEERYRRRGVRFKWMGVLDHGKLDDFIREVGTFKL